MKLYGLWIGLWTAVLLILSLLAGLTLGFHQPIPEFLKWFYAFWGLNLGIYVVLKLDEKP